ncbi:N-acetylmuramoyl-L-alanine amidase [Afifella sp. IM 167]|uniref:N-acetylmuramoyl-L-alanine amidase n=1 Tax=Afifella sp. IM 167 TaxID=2033586 RepID=UPI001CC98B26|nr:N-acetylmuramoyl-L-alanine amidase [Afifella sp. IM 167]MBZ8132234.1 N-acetylmuramoyl-L-alanine amidase [Afifella sp. IM 167]
MVRFLALLAALFWLFAPPALAASTTVSQIRVVGDGARTRIMIDLSGEPTFHILKLDAPYRLVVDLPQTDFEAAAAQEAAAGLIADYRFGQIAPGKGRIVLDLTGPVKVEKSYILPAVGDQPGRLVLDLVPSERDAFLQDAASMTIRAARGTEGEGADAEAATLASLDQPADAERRKPVVVVDAGHGGIDSGARSKDGVLEKDITLRFARALADALAEDGKTEPVLTRDSDVFLSLRERVEMAREQGAALFISIHADIVPQDYVRGATVYTLSEEASDILAAGLAARENRADILAGLALEDQPDEVANILFDLARRETRNLSMRFASSLVSDLGAAMTLNKKPRRGAAFRVLKAPDVPSVLLELGYLSNELDEKLLKSDEWQDRATHAIAQSVEEYLALPGVARR